MKGTATFDLICCCVLILYFSPSTLNVLKDPVNNKQYHVKVHVLLHVKWFHLNGHSYGFGPHTQKVPNHLTWQTKQYHRKVTFSKLSIIFKDRTHHRILSADSNALQRIIKCFHTWTTSLKTIMAVLQFENSYLPPTGLVIELTDVELCFVGKSAHGSRVVNRS